MESATRTPVSMLGNREALQSGCRHMSTQATHPILGPQTGGLELEVWATGWCSTVLGQFDSFSGLL